MINIHRPTLIVRLFETIENIFLTYLLAVIPESRQPSSRQVYKFRNVNVILLLLYSI
jgi:hypothetical protein